jgi:tetratricopeptide (TPR) repeat protein
MKRLLPPLSLFLIALIFRLINLNAIDERLWINFLSDALKYQLWAQRLLNGTDMTGVFPMGPLYPYLISLIYRLSGSVSHTAILVLQAVTGSAAVLMIYLSAKDAFGKRPAFVSGILALLYGPSLLYDGLVLSESVQYFLYATFILLILKCFSKKEWYYFIMAGIVFGLCILGRASVIVVLPFIVFLYLSRRMMRRRMIHLSLFVVFTMLTIMPVTVHNLRHGDKVLVSSNFGLNFYIGNNEQANGRYMEPKGLSLNEDFTGKRIAEKIQGKSLKPTEVSSFWFQMALRYIKEHPYRSVKLICLKFLRFFEGYEIPQAENYYYLKNFLPMMKICIIPFWIIAPLGFTAFVTTWKRKVSSRLILIFIISYSLSIIPFFVIGRYRLLIVPALLVGSGYTVLSLYEGIRKKRFEVMSGLLILLFFSFVTLPVLSENRKKDRASAFVNHGMYHIYYGDMLEAEKFFKKALTVYPFCCKALNNLAGVYFSTGRTDVAIRIYKKSAAIDSFQGSPHLNLGIIYQRLGMIDVARAEFEKAVSLGPFSIKAREYLDGILANEEAFPYEVASRLSAMGKYSEAILYYKEALKQNPHDLRIYNNFGFVLQAVGEYERAITVYEECIKKFPNEVIPLNNLASIYYKMGNIEKAKELWKKCLEINPHQPNAQRNLNVLREKEK